MVFTLFAALVIWASPTTTHAEHAQFFSILGGTYTTSEYVPNCANSFDRVDCCYVCNILEGCTREVVGSPGFGSEGSVIDNASLAHIHIATDYSVGGGGSGCSSCSAGSPSGGLPTLLLDRFHRFRDITVPGSFAPGVFSVYDTKVLFYDLVGDEGVEKRATLFNPTMMGYQSFIDGNTSHPLDPSDTADGEYVSFVNNSSRELILYSGTIGSLTAETDLADADYAVQTQYNGNINYFRIIDMVGDDETTLGDDLIVHLKLDETGSTTIASDSSGNGHDGTVTEFAGDPEWTTGKVGGALDLDDSGDKVVLDTGSGGAYKGISGDGERTVAMWVKTSMATGSQALISWGKDAQGERFTLLVRGSTGPYPYSADGKLYLYVNAPSNGGFLYGDDIVADGQWHHVVVVVPETEGPLNITHCRLYVDGRLQGVSASREQEIDTNTSEGTNVTIGSDHDSNDLTGLVDDVRIYDRALNEEEIIDLAIKTHDWAGRLERIEDRNGYGITLVYKDELDSMDPEYISPTEIAESPSRQWQIDTITDAYGRVATFSYNATQQGGRWAVDTITLPNGEDIDYTYTDGFLSGVALPDGTNSTFGRNYDTGAKCTVLEYSDAAADGTHRRKDVYLTALVYVGDDTGFVVPQAANLVRMVVNAEDEVTYLNMPKSNGYMYVYEGGEKLKRVFLNTYESRVATSWSVDDSGPFDYDDVTFTGEATYDTQDFSGGSSTWYTREPAGRTSRTGIEIDLTDYSEASLPGTRTWPDSTVARTTFNSFQQVTRSEDRLGRVTRSTFDTNGNITSREVGIANTEVYKDPTPDPDATPVDVNQAEYAKYEWVYYNGTEGVPTEASGADNKTGITLPSTDPQPANLLKYSEDANDNRTYFVYDDDNLATHIVEPDDTGTGYHVASAYVYEDDGNSARRVLKTVDAVGRENEFFYDARERVIMVQYHDDSTERTAFGNDTDGTQNLVVARQDRNGNVSTMEYDTHGRLTLRTTADYTIKQTDIVDDTEPDLLAISGISNGVNIAVEYTCTYLEGTNLTDSCTNRGEVTTTTFDYRLRSVERTSTPRDTVDLTTTTEYIDNRVFSVEDPYGRKTFNFYRDSDHALERTVRATIPDPTGEPTTFAAVAALTRAGTPSVPSANAEYLITDYDLDNGGQQVAVLDPRGVVHGTEFDSRGRRVFSIEAADEVATYTLGDYDEGLPTTGLHADHAKSETIYDDQSNVTEVRSPRYFDSTDTEGEDEANETWTYTRRNLRATHTVAAGASAYVAYDATAVKTDEEFAYYYDRRAGTTTDFRGNDWLSSWHACCGRFQGSEDPDTHGSLSNTDYYGNVVHTAVVTTLPDPDSDTGFITGYNTHNPVNGETVNESTTRFDARHRPIASTRWLVAQAEIEPNEDYGEVRIAGLDSVPKADGLTTQYLYDEDLTDGVGLDSAAGVTVQKLGSGTFTVSIVDLIDELEADSGLAGNYFSSTAGESDGYAAVVINPEEEISVRIMDGAGRTVASAILDPTDQTSPVTEPITWSTSLYDAVVTVTGFGDCLETERHDALNHVVKVRTDGSGRTIETEDAENNDAVFEYDANSNRLSVRDPNSVGLDCDFNNRNLDVSCTDTEGDETETAYNKNNAVNTRTDAKDEDTTCSYDARGRRYICTDRVASATNQRYDENSNLLRLTDGESQETDYTYNDRNLRIETEWPDTETTETTYDAARRPELATDQLGDTCTFTYDLANRLDKKEYRLAVNSPSGTIADTSTFSWDDASRIIEATTDRYSTVAGTITNTFAWDDVGRMDSEDLAVNFGTARTYTHEYAYDAANRLTQQTYPDNSVVDRDYTDRNQLDDVNYTPSGGSAAAVIDLVFDDGRRETQRTHGNGLITTKTYDRDDNYVTNIRVETALTLNDRQGLSFNYGTAGYDANKNPLLETTGGVMSGYSWTTAGGSTGAYDEEDRLTFWKRTTGSVAREWPIGATTGLTDVGDWNSVIIDGTTQTRTHGAAHMLTEINMTSTHAYDMKGNITEDKSKSPDYHYQWDFDNQMSAASVDGSSAAYEIEYTYDALGRRVSKTVPRGMGSTTTVYACMTRGLAVSPNAGQVSSEYAASVRTTLPLCKFVYGAYIDEPLILIKVDERKEDGPGDGGIGGQEIGGTSSASTIVETVYYYHTNRLYSVTGLTDSSKVVVERYAYTPYGGTVILAPNGTTVRTISSYSNPYMYTGRRWDPETGLYHYRRRPFDTDLGRFVNRDPIRYRGGLNLYEYVGNRSLRDRDPSGLRIITDTCIDAYLDEMGVEYDRQGSGPYMYIGVGVFDGGGLDQDILDLMLISSYRFGIRGQTFATEVSNLKLHIQTRIDIVANTSNKRYQFGAGDNYHAEVQGGFDPEGYVDDPQGYLDSINHPGSRIACTMATKLTFYGAIGTWEAGARRRTLRMASGDIWIPGDWGYIDNLSQNNHASWWRDGLEGENIICTGYNADGTLEYWGHFWRENTYKTIEEWSLGIMSWRSKGFSPYEGDPQVRDWVAYPSAGLN